jgi:uncharacterized protein (DUF58 family)
VRREAISLGLVSDQTRISLTPSGAGFFLLCTVLVLASLNYNNTLALSFSVFLSTIFLLALVHAWRNVAGLRLSAMETEPVFCGEPVRFRLVCRGKPPPLTGLQVLSPDNARIGVETEPGGDPRVVVLTCTPRRRGMLKLDSISLQSDYPLGICRVSVRVPLRLECLIYPAPGSLPLGEPFSEANKGRGDTGDDYDGVRRYLPGDAPHRIDWKASARSDRLLTKTYACARDDVHWIDWHSGASLPLEQHLSQMTAAVLAAAAENGLIALKLPDLEIAPGRGEAHKHACLKALALVDEGGLGF